MTAKRPEPKTDRTLTRELAARSMKRILCQFPVGHNTGDYFEAIFEAVREAELSPDLFDSACLRLASTMLPYKPPVAAEYIEAAKSIKGRRSMRLANCTDCKGRGWIYVRDLRDTGDKTQVAVNPSDAQVGEKLAVATCQACKPVSL